MASTDMATPPARPAFKPVTLTDAAAERVRSLIAQSDKPVIGLRIAIDRKSVV